MAVRTGLMEIYKRFKPSETLKLLQRGMKADVKGKGRWTAAVVDAIGEERLRDVGGMVDKFLESTKKDEARVGLEMFCAGGGDAAKAKACLQKFKGEVRRPVLRGVTVRHRFLHHQQTRRRSGRLRGDQKKRSKP